MISERLYPLLAQSHPDHLHPLIVQSYQDPDLAGKTTGFLAAKITGMLLKTQDHGHELLYLLESPGALESKVNEALEALSDVEAALLDAAAHAAAHRAADVNEEETHNAQAITKQMIGERLYPLIAQSHPDHLYPLIVQSYQDPDLAANTTGSLAATITGMLLEMDNSELLYLLESPGALESNVNEALEVLSDVEAALMDAAAHGDLESATTLLLQGGANANQASTDDGATPLFIASYGGHHEVVKLLLAQDGVAVNQATTDTGTTPLFIASQGGHLEVVKLLLAQEGVSVNQATTDDGTTPLFIASQEGHLEIVKLLLAQDLAQEGFLAMYKARTTDGAKPLHIASNQGHFEVVALIQESQEKHEAGYYAEH